MIDVARVIRLRTLADDDMSAADPEHVGREWTIGMVKLFFGNDFASIVTDGVFGLEANLCEQALPSTFDAGGFDLKVGFCPFLRFGHV